MTYSRICSRAAGLSVALALACAAALPAAEAGPNYDGLWSVVIVTKTGQCDAAYRYPIRITNGSLANAGSAPINISGKVGKNGAVIVNVSAGDKSAVGKGHLATTSGAGSWSGNGNGACSGIWEAERRG
jgi:hypothetical protein